MPSEIKANPVSYLSGGKQHIAIASGNSILAFVLEEQLPLPSEANMSPA